MRDNMPLMETAETIRKLIAENHESVPKFHTNSIFFMEKLNEYFDALEQAQINAKENPDLKNDNEGIPPMEGMVFYADPSNQIQRFWTDPLPFNPYGWILYFYDCTPYHPLKSDERPKEPSKDEMLMCEYVVLGLIFDEVLNVPECTRLCKIDIYDVRSGIMTTINDAEMIKGKINLAIDHVKADLAGNKSQKKAGQEKTDIMDYRSIAKIPISKLIKYGEGHVLEFKETLEYDIKQNKINKNLNKECLKTIVAFLNTDGGILLIGIQDNRKVTGIDRDLKYVQRKNLDGFELKLRDLIRNRLDPVPFNKVKIKFEKLDKETICKINVDPAKRDQIIHLDGKEVYIRDGNMTIKLDGRKLTNWIQQRAQASNMSRNN
jgi:hypothetical protein